MKSRGCKFARKYSSSTTIENAVYDIFSTPYVASWWLNVSIYWKDGYSEYKAMIKIRT